jgi:hypothetical protein
MVENKVSSGPSAAYSQNVTRLAFVGAAAFLALLALLHVLEPEFNPSWRLISEYEIGNCGWMMRLAFFSLGLSCLALPVAVRRYAGTLDGRIGLVLLAFVAAGLIGAGVFVTDPITAPTNALTTSGNLHNLCALVVIPGFLIAVTLIERGLPRNEDWASMRRWLPWATALVWLGFLAFVVSIFIFMPSRSGFGPDVLVGWPNRFMMITYPAWLMIVGWFTGWRILSIKRIETERN